MSLHLKLFNTTAEYNTYTADTSNFILPNVSYCKDNDDVHYSPMQPETKLVVYYDIQNISSPTTVHTNYSNSFKSMEIDGVDSVDITTQGSIQYQFSSVGEHIIKYEPTNSTVGSNSPLFYNIVIPMRVIIPNTFTRIGDNAFLSCTGLTSCTIGNGVTSIGGTAFTQCSSLTSIDIPDSVTSIGSNAFENCTGLTRCTIGNGVTSIGSKTFKACFALTNITIPDSVTSIGDSAFSGCTSLKSITIPNSVTSIGDMAFANSSTIASIVIPSNVTSIGRDAFDRCSGLTSVTVEATTPPTLGNGAFDGNATGRKIYVPSASVDSYKAATNWSEYASAIEPIS